MSAPFGHRLVVIDEIVRQSLADTSMSAPDFAVLAERLDLAARKLRAIGPLRPEPLSRAPRSLSPRRAA